MPKVSKERRGQIAKKLSDNLIATVGLKNACKVALQIRRNLLSEKKRMEDKED